MNKNLKEVLVKREYNGQVWFELKVISNGQHFKISYPKEARGDNQPTDGQSSSEVYSV